MILKYELFVCHSDHTWTEGHFIEIDGERTPDHGDFDREATESFIEDNPQMDIMFVGVYRIEEIE